MTCISTLWWAVGSLQPTAQGISLVTTPCASPASPWLTDYWGFIYEGILMTIIVSIFEGILMTIIVSIYEGILMTIIVSIYEGILMTIVVSFIT